MINMGSGLQSHFLTSGVPVVVLQNKRVTVLSLAEQLIEAKLDNGDKIRVINSLIKFIEGQDRLNSNSSERESNIPSVEVSVSHASLSRQY